MRPDAEAYRMVDGEIAQFKRLVNAAVDAVDISYMNLIVALADLTALYSHKVANMEAFARLDTED